MKKSSDKRQRSLLDPVDDDFDFQAEAQELFDQRGNLIMCMGRIKCNKCGHVYGVCCDVEVELTEKGNENMLPRPGQNAPAQSSGQQRQRSGYPYLKETDLTLDKKEARIIQVRNNDEPVKDGQRRFSDIIVKIAVGGTIYLWGMKYNNPNFTILIEAFGQNENDWAEKKCYIFLEQEEFSGRNFIRCEPQTAASKKKGG